MNFNDKNHSEFQKLCQNIGQSFICGSAIGIPVYFYHGYRYAPKTMKFHAGMQLARTRGVLLGTSFLVWRLIFESSNYVLKNYRHKDDFVNWGAGGAFVGWVLSVRAGPKLGMAWAVVYSAFYQGQYFLNQAMVSMKQTYTEKLNQMGQNESSVARDINALSNDIMVSFENYARRLTAIKQRTCKFLNNFRMHFLEGLTSL